MSKLFDDLMEGIGDMAKHVRGEHVEGITLNTVSIKPIPEVSAKDIKRIRVQMDISQGAFAAILGVSKKAVEAWEGGINTPAKPIARLLQLFSVRDDLLNELIVQEAPTKKIKKKTGS